VFIIIKYFLNIVFNYMLSSFPSSEGPCFYFFAFAACYETHHSYHIAWQCCFHQSMWGHMVAQLIETLRFLMVSLEFFIDLILSAALGSGVDSASNRNECKEYSWGIRAAGV
jgi:hypothetical protein